MNDEAMELLREFIEAVHSHSLFALGDVCDKAEIFLAQSNAAPQSRGRLTYDKATRTIRDERGNGVLVLTEEDADMFASAAPDSGEGMLEEPARWTDQTDKAWPVLVVPARDYDKLRSYALSLREREGKKSEEFKKLFEYHGDSEKLITSALKDIHDPDWR